MDRHLTEDNFDEQAREAGAALRRPAPADGMTRIRRTRRRQQQTRLAAGGAAVVAIIALGAFVATRNDDDPALVIQPQVTAAAPIVDPTATPASSAAPTTPAPTAPAPTAAPSTTAAPAEPAAPADPSGLSEDARAWIDARRAERYTTVDVWNGDAPGARLLVAQGDPSGSAASAVLLDDGRVVDAPAGAGVEAVSLYAVGGLPAMLERDTSPGSGAMWIWQLEIATESWTRSADFGLGTIDGSIADTVLPYDAMTVGDYFVVAVDEFEDPGDGTLRPSANRRGVIVGPDLSLTPMTPSPEGVPMKFSIEAGGKALAMFGPNLGSLYTPSFEQPWVFDPATNEWSEIALPEWFECSASSGACDWWLAFDGGPTVQVDTGRGVLVQLPDDTLGIYDVATGSWTRADAPFPVRGWWSAEVIGDQVVLANGRDFESGFGEIGVLDTPTGRWTSTTVTFEPDVQSQVDSAEWGDIQWDLRVTGSRVMAAPGPNTGSPLDPVTVYDATTGRWGEPTVDDIAAWRAVDNRIFL